MARKKKGAVQSQSPLLGGGEGEHMNTDISSAENGFIVNVSGHKGGKEPSYFTKRFIATSRPAALRIANQHMSGAGKAGKKKSRGKGHRKSVA